MLLCDSFFYTILPTFLRLLFAYRSLIVRSSFGESKGKLTYWLILYVFC